MALVSLPVVLHNSLILVNDVQSAEEEEAKASSELAAAIAALPDASSADGVDALPSSAPAVPAPAVPAESPEQQAVMVATKVLIYPFMSHATVSGFFTAVMTV